MKKRLIDFWVWFWGDGDTPHGKIPPYTKQIIILFFIGVLFYEGGKYLYKLIFK